MISNKAASSALIGVFLVAVMAAGLIGIPQRAVAPTSNTTEIGSNATVNVYVAFGFSSGFVTGISFGSVDPGSDDNGDEKSTADNSSLFVNISQESNVNVDLYLAANESLTHSDGTNIIGELNYTWSANKTTGTIDGTNTFTEDEYYMNSTTVNDGPTVDGGFCNQTNTTFLNKTDDYRVYFAFWLDVPDEQTAGTYGNGIQFKINQSASGA